MHNITSDWTKRNCSARIRWGLANRVIRAFEAYRCHSLSWEWYTYKLAFLAQAGYVLADTTGGSHD